MNISKIKYILLFFIFFIFSFSYFSVWADIFKSNNKDVIYCRGNECSLEKWVKQVRDTIDDVDKNRSASQYIQDIVKYLLTFVTIIAIIYVIYAWFKILISSWDEEVNKKSKSIIISVALWIVVMWLAYSIINFVLRVIWAT